MTKKHRKRGCLSKAWFLVLILLLLIGLGTTKVISELHANNLKSSVWFEAPTTVKLHSIELEWERLLYRVLPPAPAPDVYSDVTAERLDDAMCRGANWLLRMQTPSGRFRYWFDPESETYSSSQQDNFLRQAGTCFSLLQVYALTGNSAYLDAVFNSLTYLFEYKVTLDEHTSYFIFQGKSKLGGTALPMLSMLKLKQMTGTKQFDKDLPKLANMLLSLQKAYGTGRYKSTYIYRGVYEYECLYSGLHHQ